MSHSPQPNGAAQEKHVVLRDVAEDAGRAPSILNTQPWRWRLGRDRIDLYADRSRQLASLDPAGRLLIVSCGAALHHARVALSYRGYEPHVERWPTTDAPDLLATVSIAGPHRPGREDLDEYHSLRKRRTERRLAPEIQVPADTLRALQAYADREHVRLHHLTDSQLPILATAAKVAQQSEDSDRTRLAELRDWERRARATGQGVPPETVVAPVQRPVPLRDLTSGGATLLHAGMGDDTYAEYLVFATEGDGPADWLRAGEATSAVWLAATGRGLSGSVISDVIEVPDARRLLGSVIETASHPQLVMRIAVDSQPTPPPVTPRRPGNEYIDTQAAD